LFGGVAVVVLPVRVGAATVIICVGELRVYLNDSREVADCAVKLTLAGVGARAFLGLISTILVKSAMAGSRSRLKEKALPQTK
jgi:hypothetical protein